MPGTTTHRGKRFRGIGNQSVAIPPGSVPPAGFEMFAICTRSRQACVGPRWWVDHARADWRAKGRAVHHLRVRVLGRDRLGRSAVGQARGLLRGGAGEQHGRDRGERDKGERPPERVPVGGREVAGMVDLGEQPALEDDRYVIFRLSAPRPGLRFGNDAIARRANRPLSECREPVARLGWSRANRAVTDVHHRADVQGHHSAAGRIRTCDPRIKSPLLCQLSYGGERGMIAQVRGLWRSTWRIRE